LNATSLKLSASELYLIKGCLYFNFGMSKVRIAILTGGPSHTHESSILSGKTVIESLDKDKYDISHILISRAGIWPVILGDLKNKIDAAFIAMHGEYGEDGTIQDILKQARIPYTGSDVLPSALGMNKIFSSRLFKMHGLNVPKFIALSRHNGVEGIVPDFPMPVFVKRADQGLSLGVSLVRSFGEIREAVKKALRYSRDVMIQEYIPGREISCFVIDDGRGGIISLPTVEVIPKVNGFLDYHTKHTPKMFEARAVTSLPKSHVIIAQETAAKAHKIIGASGVSKVDMVFSTDGKLYVLEINTIPLMSRGSLFLQAAQIYGMAPPQLFNILIKSALNKREKTQRYSDSFFNIH